MNERQKKWIKNSKYTLKILKNFTKKYKNEDQELNLVLNTFMSKLEMILQEMEKTKIFNYIPSFEDDMRFVLNILNEKEEMFE